MKQKSLKKILTITLIIGLFFISGCGKKEFTISFNTDGGTSVIEQVVKKGDTLVKPDIPVKEGYKFLYWEMDGKEFDFLSKIKNDVTLKAKWEKLDDIPVGNKYTVIFNTDGGNNISSQQIEENKTVSKPINPTKEGYKFVEWTLDGTVYDFTAKVTRNIILVAKWEKSSTENPVVKPTTNVTVTFDSNGGSKVTNQTISAGSKVKLPAEPTRTGYKFLGWYRNNSAWDFGWTINVNITLVAKWEKVTNVPEMRKYTITFNSAGGSSVASQTVEENKTVVIPTEPTRIGYKFIGWTLDGNIYSFASKVTGNITLVAKWEQEKVEDKYTISQTLFELGPQYKVYVLKNGFLATAKAVYDVNGSKIAEYSTEHNAILMLDKYIKLIAKVELDDGNIYNITK